MTRAVDIDIPNPSAVKVVTDLSGRALYFSRATIPFDRDGTKPRYFKHLGLYAYRKSALDRFVTLPESSLEKSERLDFRELGFDIGGSPTFRIFDVGCGTGRVANFGVIEGQSHPCGTTAGIVLQFLGQQTRGFRVVLAYESRLAKHRVAVADLDVDFE